MVARYLLDRRKRLGGSVRNEKVNEFMEKFYADAMVVRRDRGLKYSTAEDGLKNLRKWGRIGVLIRIDDKLSRLQTLTESGAEFSDESVRDTCLDLANYSGLFLALGEKGEES